MNILPREKQIEAISALCEGVSIRATERLTGIHHDTIMRLGTRAGAHFSAILLAAAIVWRINRVRTLEPQFL